MLNWLSKNPLFNRTLLALFVSGIGTSFTSVAVYTEMSRLKMGALGFAVAYAAALLPGYFSSQWVTNIRRHWSVGHILIGGQWIGLLCLSFPLFGAESHQIWALIMAEICASAVGGILLPIYKQFERECLNEEFFAKFAAFDTFILTANFIFGQGLGALLSSMISLKDFLAIDALTYLAAIILLWPLLKIKKSHSDDNSKSGEPAKQTNYSEEQKRALWILPWLALVCAPPMVILPARGMNWGEKTEWFGLIALTPVIFLLCARTLGQIAGPLLTQFFPLDKIKNRNAFIASLLGLYLILYVGAFRVESLGLAAVLVVIAHMSSNVVYTLGNYSMLKSFNSDEMLSASAWLHRAMVLITGISGLAAGFLSDQFGINTIFAICIANLLLGLRIFSQKGV